ncbi:MAG: hypothetical protein HY678_01110 [Chloroflexi bacterium]|nr:hypothetical protein [Chloroflexota bacterium]
MPQAGPDCGPTTLTVESRGVVVFELLRQAGDRFNIEPGEPFSIRVRNVPSSGKVDVMFLLPFGRVLTQSYSWSGLDPGGEYLTTVDPGEYAGLSELRLSQRR